MDSTYGPEGVPEGLLEFFQSNIEWTTTTAKSLSRVSDYWRAVEGVLQQLGGLVRGYELSLCSEKYGPISFIQFWVLNSYGGYSEIGCGSVTIDGYQPMKPMVGCMVWGQVMHMI